MFTPGDKFDRYVIAGLLGKGGMGEVYRAHDTRLQRAVALKIVRADPTGGSQPTSDGVARVLREARAAAALNHPNAVAIFDVGALEGVWYLAMELIVGKSLRAYVGDTSVRHIERIRWLLDVARALSAAHARGLVHRDIKPENVMVREDGVVKVLDFGIARRSSSPVDPTASTAGVTFETLTGKGVVVGTPRYMAPEQLRGDPVTSRTDVFAWGVLAYEMLTGALPWHSGEGGVHLVSQILTNDPPPVRERDAAIPEDVSAIIVRAMTKAPEGRPASMEIIASVLEMQLPTSRRTSLPIGSSTTRPSAVQPGSGVSTRTQLATSITPAVRGRRAWLALGAVVVAAGAFAGWRALRPVGPAPSSSSSVAASSSAALAASAPVEARSSNGEASSAYHIALQLLRDATSDVAIDELDRASKLDPLFSPAHLRRAIAAGWPDASAREAYQRAVQLRAGLDERDRSLLDAYEPWSRFVPDLRETERRLTSAVNRYPRDVELALHLCRARVAIGDAKRADAACDAALVLDGTIAEAWHEKAVARALAGDAPGASKAYEECLSRAPSASDCLRDLVELRSNEGQCDESLQLARRLVAAHAKEWSGHARLAAALYGAGQPVESVRVALGHAWERAPEDVKRREQPRADAQLAVLVGDLGKAAASLASLDTEIAASTEESDHVAVARARWEVALEAGKKDDAARIATEYLKKRAAWAPDATADPTIFAQGARYRAGASTRAEWVTARDAWLSTEKEHTLESLLFGVSAADRWHAAYVDPAWTVDDARDAMSALPPSTSPGALREGSAWEGPLGAVYLLSGAAPAAIAPLAHASASCDAMLQPLAHTRALAHLGAAREAAGDKDAACKAYASVLARWGTARPRSVTADDARARSRALGCAP